MSEERDTTTEQDPATGEPVDGVHAAAEPEAPAADAALSEDAAAEPADVATAEPADVAAAAADYKDLYLRAAAESDNIRKRARRDVEAAQARGVARLVRELLPSLDNLDRALAHAEAEEGDDEHHLTKGIRLVQQELLGALSRAGVEAYSPDGETFDPHVHEAVAQQPVEGAPSGTIVQVYQQGYRYKDEVLRAAKVVVAA